MKTERPVKGKTEKPKKRKMPAGDPFSYPTGSPQSRAAARAMVDAYEREHTLVVVHSIPRPRYSDRPEPEMTKDGHYILRIRRAE
jgi:hypothetical protein